MKSGMNCSVDIRSSGDSDLLLLMCSRRRAQAFLRAVVMLWLLCCLVATGFRGISQPFAEDIRKFREQDSLRTPPPKAILFAGSSSFTMWKDVGDYFPGHIIINRGFGGSTLADQIRYFDQVYRPCSPRQVVLYCGENDFAASDTVTVAMVTQRFTKLFGMIRKAFPKTRITYISIKPSPSRWNLAPRFRQANDEIMRFIKKQPRAGFVNVWDMMLNAAGTPDSTIFLDDRLHMNVKGYRIWQEAIRPTLIKQIQ